MAFASSVAWEVRPTNGSDSNGGGFDAVSGVPGTDFSQQDAAQQAYTDLVIDGATNTKATSAAHPLGATAVGNIFNITAGTGWTVQRVQLLSVAAGVGTFDKALGTVGSTGGTGNMGGALKTLQTAVGSSGLVVAGNTVWMRYAANTAGDTITASIQLPVSGDLAIGVCTLRGYDTTRGDNTGNRPLITCATNSVKKIDFNQKNYWVFENLHLTDTAGTRGHGFSASSGGASTGIVIRNCVIDGMANGVSSSDIVDYYVEQLTIDDCEIKNCTTDGIQITGRVGVFRCYIHDNTGSGIRHDANIINCFVNIRGNFISKNGAKGISLTSSAFGRTVRIEANVIYKNTGDGVNWAVTNAVYLAINLDNNIIYGNGAFGVTFNNSTNQIIGSNHTNAWGSNTSGDTSNWTKAGDDLTLTANPLTSDTDCTLNATAGGGPVCKAAGFPGKYKGAATLGYIDVNAIQHQDVGGAAGIIPCKGLTGGMTG